MDDPAEKFGETSIPAERSGKKWEFVEDKEARLRNRRHLEMAYEWLRGRGKIAPLKGGAESPQLDQPA